MGPRQLRPINLVEEKLKRLLTVGPKRSTNTPATGDRIYVRKMETDPIHEIADSDIWCSKFAL